MPKKMKLLSNFTSCLEKKVCSSVSYVCLIKVLHGRKKKTKKMLNGLFLKFSATRELLSSGFALCKAPKKIEICAWE